MDKLFSLVLTDVGREQQPHVKASLVDPLLLMPKEEIHDYYQCYHHWKGRKGLTCPPMVCRLCQGREWAIPMVREGCTKEGRRDDCE